jgi:hypothetical protein
MTSSRAVNRFLHFDEAGGFSMNVLRVCTAVVTAFFLFTATASALPFAQAPQQQAPAKTHEPVTGQLLSLDTDAKTIVIKTAGDTEMKFSFSESTEIVGAEKGAAGLATVSGSIVTVTYDVHGTANVATKIEVKPKK